MVVSTLWESTRNRLHRVLRRIDLDMAMTGMVRFGVDGWSVSGSLESVLYNAKNAPGIPAILIKMWEKGEGVERKRPTRSGHVNGNADDNHLFHSILAEQNHS